jgi:ketosteroid isomerase-like protein
MYKIFVAIAVSVLTAGPVAAFDDNRDVMTVVRQFVDGFNKGEVKTAVAACSEQTSIIDEFPPHEWHGAGACLNWANDYDADARKNGITDGVVTLRSPRHIDITGDRAYVVVPVNYTFKKKGALIKEVGSTFTIALQKEKDAWRITGWAWAKR